MTSKDFPQIIHKLLVLIPPYVLGCFPALIIIGASPLEKKVAWLFRCIGCPFTSVFYTLNIGSKKKSLFLYWLSSDYFIINGRQAEVRPFGFHVLTLSKIQGHNIDKYVNRTTTNVSLLERISSFV